MIRAVTFDAAGTLIGVRRPVGETYARFAREAGYDVDAEALGQAFRTAIDRAPPLVGPVAVERGWWRDVVRSVLIFAGGSGGGMDGRFESFFAEVFAFYARPDAWQLLPDAIEVLDELARRSILLAIVSNFDTRLHAILDGLGIRDRFAAIVLSSEAGAAKPAREIFVRALADLGGIDPAHAAHVGDSLPNDAIAAARAGLRGFWLDRATHAGPGGEPVEELAPVERNAPRKEPRAAPSIAPLPPGVIRLPTLADLVDALSLADG